MLCLADRNFLSFDLWEQAQRTGADLLWRAKQGRDLPEDQRLVDGSYLSRIFPGDHRKRHSDGIKVRVIEYRLYGVADAEPMYRLVTTILDPAQAGAGELAALYHERWEIETVLGELKTHLRGSKIVLRSKTPELVRQEIYGLLLAHFAIRGLMHEAALKADEDPDRLSFIHAVRVVRRKIAAFGCVPPRKRPALQSRAGRNPPGAAGAARSSPQQARRQTEDEQLPHQAKGRRALAPNRHHTAHSIVN